MENLKMLFTNYINLEAAADAADLAWEQDPENEELEAAFDSAYEAEHEALQSLLQEIVSFTNGQINLSTARMMLMSKREELQALISMI